MEPMKWHVKIHRAAGVGARYWCYTVIGKPLSEPGSRIFVKLVGHRSLTRYGAKRAARKQIKHYISDHERKPVSYSWWDTQEFEYDLIMPLEPSRF